MSWDPGGVTYSDTDPTLGPPITRLVQPASTQARPPSPTPPDVPLLLVLAQLESLRRDVAALRTEVYHRSLEGLCARAWDWVMRWFRA